MPVRRSAAGHSRLHRKVGLPGRPASPGGFASARLLPGQRQAAPPGKMGRWQTCPGVGPGKPSSVAPWQGSDPYHSLPDAAIRHRSNPSKLASARAASASCCVQSHYPAIPSVPRPLSKPCAATENPLPCHIRPHGAHAASPATPSSQLASPSRLPSVDSG